MSFISHIPYSRLVSFLGIFAFGIWISSCITPRKGPAKVLAATKSTQPFDAVIIPGYPYYKGGWDSVMKARVLWSWILYKNGLAKNIIYSGAAVYTPYKESVIMSLYAEQLGIPRVHIFQDTQARHSTENIYFSYLLAKEKGFKTIAVATDPFQSFMLRGFTRRRFGTPVFHIPFVLDSLQAYNGLNPIINPDTAFVESWVGIRQQQGFIARIKGTMGRDINWRKYRNGMLEPL